MLARKEVVVIVDGKAMKKETTVLATDQGVIALEVTSLSTQQPQLQNSYMPSVQNQQPQRPAIRYREPEPEGCCEDCFCCHCEGGYKWYSCEGKGPGAVLLLLLMYLVVFSVGLPLVLCYMGIYCVCLFMGCFNDDD